MATRRKRKVRDEDAAGIIVKVARTGGRVEEYHLDGEEPTVGDALEKAGISVTKGDRIRLGGDIVDEDTIVSDGDLITVAGKVSGGFTA